MPVLARDLEQLCKPLNIKEIPVIKNKNNEKTLRHLLLEMKNLQLILPRFLVTRDVLKTFDEDDKKLS